MTTSTSTVLIIEDFSADRELYRRALLADANISYHLLEAESVAEGLELCQSKKIDAVLLDYLLPDADGLEFLEQLADRNDPDTPPVVMLTGQGSESIAVRAIKLGAQDYLIKRNLTPELLQLTVRKGSWFETHLYPAGEGLGIYFRDISRRKRMEAERLAAEQERDCLRQTKGQRFFNLSIYWESPILMATLPG
jgi:CheY-like chemotaxis protein